MSDAQIHVAKNGKPFGTFTESDLSAALADGRISAQDLCWQNGMSAWLPIAQAFPQLVPTQATAAFVANDGAMPPAAQAAAAPTQAYPSGWERFGAYIIDVLVMLIPVLIVAALVGALTAVGLRGQLASQSIVLVAQGLGVCVGAVLMMLYYGIMGSASGNATVGQRAMSFQMVDAKTGAAPSKGQVWQWAVTRSLVLQCCSCFGFLLCIPILTDARKQSLFDSWSGLVMVKK
jgi:uncharacterized RDD family membrane protein YckC